MPHAASWLVGLWVDLLYLFSLRRGSDFQARLAIQGLQSGVCRIFRAVEMPSSIHEGVRYTARRRSTLGQLSHLVCCKYLVALLPS